MNRGGVSPHVRAATAVTRIKPGMELDPQLQKALEKLAKGGEKIGQPTTVGGELVIPVNGVLLTPEKVFATAQIDPHPKPKP